MAGYKPLYIRGETTGLVQDRVEFILPDDAHPVLNNAFVWRERIKRKQGVQLLGRLRRILLNVDTGQTSNAGNNVLKTFSDIYNNVGIDPVTEPNAEIILGSVVFTVGAPDNATFTDNGDGTLTGTGAGAATGSTINYRSGLVRLQFAGITTGGATITVSLNYYPALPVMGLLTRELNNTNNEQTIAFDQKYAYRFGATGWEEFIPGTTWTGNDSDFFWGTNYYVGDNNLKIFWVTNFSGTTGDPIRYTNGIAWVDFAPQINNAGDRLEQCLAMLPFRGRLVVFNTLEGANLGASVAFRNRIRWSAIGTPFSDVAPGVVSTVNPNAWRDDIRGQGGYLDIPTSESIISVGFVRDNLVVYCERSTWQLRYTGRSISPFQIEKVNSELGAESTFSAVQFDTSLVGVGDKGIVECDSFKSTLIDIKIPDLVFSFKNTNQGTKRVYGVRDFIQRLAYWTYVYVPSEDIDQIFPNRRLVYNYENDSWAIFTDSFTCFGTFQPDSGRTWANTPYPWETQDYTWESKPALIPDIIAGNQQGFVEYIDYQVTNDVSLTINNISGNSPNVTTIQSVNHNLETGQIIKISNIPTGTGYSTLNDQKFYVQVIDADNFSIWKYSTDTQQFTDPQVNAAATYLGGGMIAILDNFNIISKKFNFLEDGQNIQLGYIDVLLNATSEGAITLNVYLDYNNSTPINRLYQNLIPGSNPPVTDDFFNQTVPTTTNNPNGLEGAKYWHRVFCPARGAFITIEWTLSNAQLVGPEQSSDVEIDTQILWLRRAGRQLPVGE